MAEVWFQTKPPGAERSPRDSSAFCPGPQGGKRGPFAKEKAFSNWPGGISHAEG